MEYLQRLPLASTRVVACSLAVVGVVALGVVRFGWGIGYNPILTPFGVIVVGASLLVIALSTLSRVSLARVCIGVAVLLLATLYLANRLRIVGPTEGDGQLVGAFAHVLVWAPVGLGVLAGFVSADRFPTIRIGVNRIRILEWAVFTLGLLGQVTGLLLIATYVLTDPVVSAGAVYTMMAVVSTIAWIASYPFYLAGRDLQ